MSRIYILVDLCTNMFSCISRAANDIISHILEREGVEVLNFEGFKFSVGMLTVSAD